MSDRATSRILEIDPTTGASSTYLSGVPDPVALAFDAAGNLYVATHNGGYLAKYNPAGQLVSAQWVPQSLGYVDIAEIWVCGDTLYFTGTNAGKLYAFNLLTGQGGAVADYWTNGLRDPYGLACDCEGKVYISNAGWPSIVRWDPLTGASAVVDDFNGSITPAAGPYGLLIVPKQ